MGSRGPHKQWVSALQVHVWCARGAVSQAARVCVEAVGKQVGARARAPRCQALWSSRGHHCDIGAREAFPRVWRQNGRSASKGKALHPLGFTLRVKGLYLKLYLK